MPVVLLPQVIVCVAVNDAFVMGAWGAEHKADGKVRGNIGRLGARLARGGPICKRLRSPKPPLLQPHHRSPACCCPLASLLVYVHSLFLSMDHAPTARSLARNGRCACWLTRAPS